MQQVASDGIKLTHMMMKGDVGRVWYECSPIMKLLTPGCTTSSEALPGDNIIASSNKRAR